MLITGNINHVAAFSFEKVLKSIRSKYVYGLTATPTRKDGWHKIIYIISFTILCSAFWGSTIFYPVFILFFLMIDSKHSQLRSFENAEKYKASKIIYTLTRLR